MQLLTAIAKQVRDTNIYVECSGCQLWLLYKNWESVLFVPPKTKVNQPALLNITRSN
jgi:hypothetical protein